MTDRNTISHVIESLFEDWIDKNINVHPLAVENMRLLEADALALLKEQEKKPITVHKRHVITLRRNDIFSMKNLYESICETLMDEGSLIIVRKDDHEKVDFEWEIVDNSET